MLCLEFLPCSDLRGAPNKRVVDLWVSDIAPLGRSAGLRRTTLKPRDVVCVRVCVCVHPWAKGFYQPLQ